MKRLSATTLACAFGLMLAGCAQMPVGEAPPSSSAPHSSPAPDQSPGSLPAPEAGWKWNVQGGVAFQTPNDLTFGWPPDTSWCLSDTPPPAGTRYVVPMHSHAVAAIGCPKMPESYHVPWVAVERSENPEEVIAAVGSDEWVSQKPGETVRHEAKEGVGADDTAGEGQSDDPREEYVRYKKSIGPVTLTVGLPATAIDEEFATKVLASLTPIATTPAGCPSVATPGPAGQGLAKDSDGDLVVCQYLAGHQRAGADSAPRGLLIGETTISGDAAKAWITAYLDAPEGLGPNSPDTCMEGLEDGEFLQVRSGEGMVNVRYVGCRANGLSDGSIERQLTKDNCPPLFTGGTTMMQAASSPIAEVCIPPDSAQ